MLTCRIQIGAEFMMRGAQCMISEGLMKELPFLALLENPSQGHS